MTEGGPDRGAAAGAGVADIMARAGLTHGGFYAHFGSRESLVAEALKHANHESLTTLSRSLETLPPEAQLLAVAEAYLSAWHVRHVDAGCPFAAVGPEVARTSGTMLRNLQRMVRERLAWLRGLARAGQSSERREEQAVGALACMVAGLILARALGARESTELLEACRDFLRQALGDAPMAPSVTRPSEWHAKAARARSASRPT